MKLNTKKKMNPRFCRLKEKKIFPLFKSKKIEIKKNN